ncbi:hypothetical protein WEH80_37160 [Actinomycetes bacterium KLBMP 9759]
MAQQLRPDRLADRDEFHDCALDIVEAVQAFGKQPRQPAFNREPTRPGPDALALNQRPAFTPHRQQHGRPILVRADTAGCTKGFLAHVRDHQDKLMSCEFSVSWAITDRERAAIAMVPRKAWTDAVDADGGHRDGAGLAELTGLLPATSLEGYPRHL